MRNVAKATNNKDKLIDTKELFREYKETKDRDIRNRLIENYMYIVDILSKKFINKGIEYEDIYQVGSLGLIYAIDRFDVEKGYEFSSFATPTIVGEIKKYFRDKGWAIRVPRRIQELSKKVNKAKVELQQRNQKVPKVIDIAAYLGCSEEEVLEAMEASQGYNTKSLDITYDNDGDDKQVKLIDLMGDEDKNFSKIDNEDFLNKFMKTLDEVQIKIMKDRFFENKTQSELAKELNVSQMTISRIEKKIVMKLRQEYEKI
ncbi:SigB/SigF/SigG family RNA polymerase sigma factor [Tepidibacter hydrothermalis]|uniref:SigB/SigF/SigG family RNA polymerase sigma factor n=1 Tax=Tepidibacter hydrothermalis TaxID=3036126 RepID=A0ABY8EBL7_9FIRM|nr:SigB/SigF/SigG family RNA polymerase sigma factor [Tepidibacter hydrothermalis]WFD10299.1 SigB/SigF/SigG family RNA polymerase sigma factor [Tepidibacter hydrothermalis]